MKQRDDSIEFDVNEVLYFETGQEIDEMLAISLDPDIAIQTYDQYIQIRGIILLQGEYKRAAMIPNRSVSPNENEFTKFIEKVYEMDDERSRFSHRFPVEISVPPKLVDNPNDVTVSVDAFDYELPNQNKLNIHASIHIHGVNNEMDSKEVKEDSMLETNQFEKTSEISRWKEEGELEDMSLDKKNLHENQTEVSEVADSGTEQVEMGEVVDSGIEQVEVSEVVDSGIERVEVSEIIDSANKQTEAVSSRDSSEYVLEVEKSQEVDKIEEVGLTEATVVELVGEVARVDETEQVAEIDIQLNESKTDEGNEEVRDVQFLTDLFGGEQEESITKLRIYIIQEDDSVESIAKKYEVSSLQIMKDNEISGENLEVGQLLYLPVKTDEK